MSSETWLVFEELKRGNTQFVLSSIESLLQNDSHLITAEFLWEFSQKSFSKLPDLDDNKICDITVAISRCCDHQLSVHETFLSSGYSEKIFRILYHILTTLLKKVLHPQSVQFAKRLWKLAYLCLENKNLQSGDLNGLKTISSNIQTICWNAAVALLQKQRSSVTTIIDLFRRSVQFYCISFDGTDCDTLFKKLAQVVVSVKDEKCIGKELVRFFQSTLPVFHKRLIWNESEIGCYTDKMYGFLVSWIKSTHQILLPDEVDAVFNIWHSKIDIELSKLEGTVKKCSHACVIVTRYSLDCLKAHGVVPLTSNADVLVSRLNDKSGSFVGTIIAVADLFSFVLAFSCSFFESKDDLLAIESLVVWTVTATDKCLGLSPKLDNSKASRIICTVAKGFLKVAVKFLKTGACSEINSAIIRVAMSSCVPVVDEKMSLCFAGQLSSLANLCYSNGDYQNCILFSTAHTDFINKMLSILEEKEPGQYETKKKGTYFKCQNLLINSLIKLESFELALKNWALPYLHLKEDELNFAQWCYIKLSAIKKNHTDQINLTIVDVLKVQRVNLSVENQVEVLRAEIAAYKTDSNFEVLKLPLCQAIQQLTQLVKDPVELGIFQIECSIFAPAAQQVEWKTKEGLQKNLDLLSGCLKGKIQPKEKARAQIYLALGYHHLWKISQDTLKDAILKSIESSIQASKVAVGPAPITDPQDVCDIVSSFAHVNLATEVQNLEKLNVFLDAVSSVKIADVGWKGLDDIIVTRLFQSIRTMTEVYIGSHMISQAIKALSLSISLSVKHYEIYLKAYPFEESLRLISLLNRAGFPSSAMQTAVGIEDKLTKNMHRLCKSTAKDYQMMLKFVQAESYYYLGEMNSSANLLLEIVDPKNLQVTCVHGLAYSLLGQVTALHPVSSDSSRASSCPLFYAKKGLHIFIQLLRFHSSRPSASKNQITESWHKTYLANLLLDAAQLVIKLYIDSGSSRDARAYLLEHLPHAQKFSMTVKGAGLLYDLAHVDWLNGAIKDCTVKLQGIFHTLCYAKVEDLSILDLTADCNDEEEPTDYSLGRISLSANSQQQACESRCASPVTTQRIGVKETPLALKHLSACICLHCQSSDTAVIYLRSLILNAKCAALEQNYPESLKILQQVSKHLEFLKQKYSKTGSCIKDCLKPLAKELGFTSLKKLEFTDRQIALLEIEYHETLASCFLARKEFSNALQELQHGLMIIANFYRKGLPFFKNLQASLVYLKAITQLNQLSIQLKTDFFGLFRQSHGCGTQESIVPDTGDLFETPIMKPRELKLPRNQIRKFFKAGSFFAKLDTADTAITKATKSGGTENRVLREKSQLEDPSIFDFPLTSPKAKPIWKAKGSSTAVTKGGGTENRVLREKSQLEEPSVFTSPKAKPKRMTKGPTTAAAKTATTNPATEKRVLRDKSQFKEPDVSDFSVAEPKSRRKTKDTTGRREAKQSGVKTIVTRTTRATAKMLTTEESRADDCDTIPLYTEESRAEDSDTAYTEEPRADDENCDPNLLGPKKTTRKAKKYAPPRFPLSSKLEEPRDSSPLVISSSAATSKPSRDTFNIYTDKLEDLCPGTNQTSLKRIEENLLEARELIAHHPPAMIYARINLLLTLLITQKKELDDKLGLAAKCFQECVGLTIRHHWIYTLHRRRDVEKDISIQDLLLMRSTESALAFSSVSHSYNLANHISEDWTILQVCAVPDPTAVYTITQEQTPNLLLSRFTRNEPPIYVLLTNRDSMMRSSFLKKFKLLLEEADASLKKCAPKEWWERRRHLDADIENFSRALEGKWLGCWKSFFLGKSGDPKQIAEVDRITGAIVEEAKRLGLPETNVRLLRVVVESGQMMDYPQISSVLYELWGIRGTNRNHYFMASFIQKELKNLAPVKRKPLLLILDKHLLPLPWESMPLIAKNPVFRIPSMETLTAHLIGDHESQSNLMVKGIDANQGFYVVNPGSDLTGTEKRMQEFLTSMPQWSGVIGRPPTQQEMASSVTNYDFYLYSGHGSGRMYLQEPVEYQKCKAAAMLMGCSSGRLQSQGFLEPTGTVLSYWIAGCPMIIANLWNVTDKDIDSFTMAFISKFLYQKSNDDWSISEAMVFAKEACVLKNNIGSAPVIYGLPVKVTQPL